MPHTIPSSPRSVQLDRHHWGIIIDQLINPMGADVHWERRLWLAEEIVKQISVAQPPGGNDPISLEQRVLSLERIQHQLATTLKQLSDAAIRIDSDEWREAMTTIEGNDHG